MHRERHSDELSTHGKTWKRAPYISLSEGKAATEFPTPGHSGKGKTQNGIRGCRGWWGVGRDKQAQHGTRPYTVSSRRCHGHMSLYLSQPQGSRTQVNPSYKRGTSVSDPVMLATNGKKW